MDRRTLDIIGRNPPGSILFASKTGSRLFEKVLIGDNLSSHINQAVIDQCTELNIAFVCLPANSTHLTQPLNVAVYSSLKKNWRAVLTEWKTSKRSSKYSTVPKDQFPALLNKLMKRMREQFSENLRSGFRKCGIHPLDSEPVFGRLPKARPHHISRDLISEVVLDKLKDMRHGDDGQPPRKRAKRLTVPAGQSVSAASEETDDTSSMIDDTDGEDDSPAAPAASPASDTDANGTTASAGAVQSAQPSGSGDSSSEVIMPAVNSWVVVRYKTPSRILHYLGTVIGLLDSDIESDDEESTGADLFRVKLLRRAQKMTGKFVWPPNPLGDYDAVKADDIVALLPAPDIDKRGHHTFSEKDLQPFKNIQ